jgi:hypothetical protein
MHRAQGQLVAIEVRVDVHPNGEQRRQNQGRPTEQCPREHDHRGHTDQQQECLQPVGMRMPGHWNTSAFVDYSRSTPGRTVKVPGVGIPRYPCRLTV